MRAVLQLRCTMQIEIRVLQILLTSIGVDISPDLGDIKFAVFHGFFLMWMRQRGDEVPVGRS